VCEPSAHWCCLVPFVSSYTPYSALAQQAADISGFWGLSFDGRKVPMDVDRIYKPNDWNQLHIIAVGNQMVHLLNGRVISIFIDEDPKFQRKGGLLGLEVEATGKLFVRNVWLKKAAIDHGPTLVRRIGLGIGMPLAVSSRTSASDGIKRNSAS